MIYIFLFYFIAQDHYLEEDEVIEDPTKVDLHSLFSDVVEDEGAAEDEEPEHEDHEDDIAQADSTPELLSAQENEVRAYVDICYVLYIMFRAMDIPLICSIVVILHYCRSRIGSPKLLLSYPTIQLHITQPTY